MILKSLTLTNYKSFRGIFFAPKRKTIPPTIKAIEPIPGIARGKI